MSKKLLKYMFRIFLAVILFGVVLHFKNKTDKTNLKKQVIEYKVDSLLALMTMDEKIGQMSQIRHFDDIGNNGISNKFIGSVIHTQGPLPGSNAQEWQDKIVSLQKKALSTRLGIPLMFAVDAVHGQNTFEGATIFPHNIGMAASRNENLVREAARITAIEVQGTGFNWTFSPCAAIPFNEKWGRVYEAYSENSELTTKLVKSSVEGLQENLNQKTSILATVKHFVGDGSTENGLEGGSTIVDKSMLEQLLLPYRAAVQEDVGAIMVSFNSLNGTNMHGNKLLITDSLKVGMNFNGIVITDWKGYSRFGGNAIINAGVDMVMAVDGDLNLFQTGLKNGIIKGEVLESRVDDAVRRILRQKFRMNLFNKPFPDSSLINEIGKQSHRVVARQAVRESLVLLKNEGNCLPLNKDISKIVVVGEHANNSGLQSGGWTVDWQGVREDYHGATSILSGIKEIANGEVVYDQFGEEAYFDADVAIIVVGETPYAEFKGDIDEYSNYQLTLTNKHKKYIDTYLGKVPKIITLLVSGRPLVVTEQINKSDAFVATWLLGSEGDGVAEVLFGDYNFKGRLPHSWPKTQEDVDVYGPNFWDDSKQPLYKIGFGLKY